MFVSLPGRRARAGAAMSLVALLAASMSHAAPPNRGGHSAIFDSNDDRVIVFGGIGSGLLNDVWQLAMSTGTWTQLFPAGTPPPPVYAHSAIYDPLRDRMIVFGGEGSSGYEYRTWALSLSGSPIWTELAPANEAHAYRKANHSAIYDPVRDRMIVFGGYRVPYQYGNSYTEAVWTLSLSGSPEWQPLGYAGSPPPGRIGHAAAYDATNDRMLVFGGSLEPVPQTEDATLWSLDLSGIPEWSPVGLANPPAVRTGPSMIHDVETDQPIVFGGYDYCYLCGGSYSWSTYYNDTWTAAEGTGSWSAVGASGGPPPPMAGHEAVLDEAGDRMIVYSGYETWILTLRPTPTWSMLTETTGVDDPVAIGQGVRVSPNPVRGPMRLDYALPQAGRVRLSIVDLQGREVAMLAEGWREAGAHQLAWDVAAAIAPGVYFARLQRADGVHVRRFAVAR